MAEEGPLQAGLVAHVQVLSAVDKEQLYGSPEFKTFDL
jgi:hypothetical protein